MVQQINNLTHAQKLVLILLVTGILTYFTAGFFGWLIASILPLDKIAIVGTVEFWQYIFGLFFAPSFFISTFLFLFVKKEQPILRSRLLKINKGVLILLATVVLTYFTAGFFGRIESKFYDLGGTWIGTTEAWLHIFGLMIAPTFFLSLLLFLLVRKEEIILWRVFVILIAVIVFINFMTGFSSIIFSFIYISISYALAKSLLYFQSLFKRKF